jgi:hypothetical protein
MLINCPGEMQDPSKCANAAEAFAAYEAVRSQPGAFLYTPDAFWNASKSGTKGGGFGSSYFALTRLDEAWVGPVEGLDWAFGVRAWQPKNGLHCSQELQPFGAKGTTACLLRLWL